MKPSSSTSLPSRSSRFAAARARLQQRARAAAKSIPILPGYERHHFSYKFEHWKDVIVLPKDLHTRAHTFLDYDCEAMCFRTLFGELLPTRRAHLEYLSRCLPGEIPRPSDG